MRISKYTAFDDKFEEELLDGVVTVEGDATRTDPNSWAGSLYKSTNDNKIPVKVKAVPYYASVVVNLGKC
ncbi:hypothetical protein KM885_10990 [Oceanobacillus caeni]|uniref:hypothetical protein n=1 Tax=Oceanobacillus caeni TaxID=405946 RepID=UPI001C2317F6|nr:hypothetical protein [Oceanobacillus caeni]MBU8791310.1 hypothetical protein [Oceanobacillus caeni]